MSSSVAGTATAPNGAYVARCIERRGLPDINYVISVREIETGRGIVEWMSSDERPTDGSIVLSWNSDSSAVLLTGTCFFLEDEQLKSADGPCYVLVAVPSGDIWTNARQAAQADSKLTTEILGRFGFSVVPQVPEEPL